MIHTDVKEENNFVNFHTKCNSTNNEINKESFSLREIAFIVIIAILICLNCAGIFWYCKQNLNKILNGEANQVQERDRTLTEMTNYRLYGEKFQPKNEVIVTAVPINN